MIRLALFGHPVSQSLSPRIHGLFAQQAELPVDYRAIDTAPGTLAAALQRFAAGGGTGCNITLPLKGEAKDLAAGCSERVRLAGAANTLILDDGGWHAESTDGPGLVMDLARLGANPGGQRVAILGAGGAAASVLASLLAAKPRSIDIFNRTAASARALAMRHAQLGAVRGCSMDSLGEAGPFGLVINATSAGHAGALPPVHDKLVGPDGFFYDMNYGPAAEALTGWCREQRIAHAQGLGMLVGQAAESFALWTGFQPDIDPVLKALETRPAH